jgi:hypothetical protein
MFIFLFEISLSELIMKYLPRVAITFPTASSTTAPTAYVPFYASNNLYRPIVCTF